MKVSASKNGKELTLKPDNSLEVFRLGRIVGSKPVSVKMNVEGRELISVTIQADTLLNDWFKPEIH